MLLYDRRSDFVVSRGIDADLISVLTTTHGGFTQPDPAQEATGSETAHSFQPWREFWPPNPGSPIYRLWEVEHPDVLSWTFSVDRIFDHPWHTWSLSVRGQKKMADEIDLDSLNLLDSRMLIH